VLREWDEKKILLLAALPLIYVGGVAAL